MHTSESPSLFFHDFARKVACEVIDLMTMESQSVMADDVDEVDISSFSFTIR